MVLDSRDPNGVGRPAAVGEYKAYDSSVRYDSDFAADRWLSMEGS